MTAGVARLLEQNVRVFLQARGKVNRGLRNTIANNPEMFFAYNNGITATAESIEARESPNGLLLTGMRNFQIVNGGQTTASIHAALRNKEVDLDQSLRPDEALHRQLRQGNGELSLGFRSMRTPRTE